MDSDEHGRCPNSRTGRHDFTVTGRNEEKAKKYGFVPCMYCSKLVPYAPDRQEE